MQPARIEGATNDLKAPQGWDRKRDGACGTLPVRVHQASSGPAMTSAWQPTPEELAALNAGASVHLTIYGAGHPVVSLGVGPVPQDNSSAG